MAPVMTLKDVICDRGSDRKACQHHVTFRNLNYDPLNHTFRQHGWLDCSLWILKKSREGVCFFSMDRHIRDDEPSRNVKSGKRWAYLLCHVPLVDQPAMGRMARPWWHPETGSRIDLGTHLGTSAKFLIFNRTQSRVLTGLLTGHNTLRRHLYLLGLLDSSFCRRCGVREETSAHILCECEVWPHSEMRIWAPFFWSLRILRV